MNPAACTKTYPSTWSHYKVLILGTGGSGKSTNFKHCTIIGDGINEDERARSVRIFCGLLQVARSLVSAVAPHEATEEEVALLMVGGGAAENVQFCVYDTRNCAVQFRPRTTARGKVDVEAMPARVVSSADTLLVIP